MFLTKLIRSGRPAPGRTDDLPLRLREQAIEVFGQKRLIRWSIPGFAHFLTFWGFVVLGLTIVEAAGALLLNQDFAIWFVGRARWIGFLEDFFAVAVLRGPGGVRAAAAAQRPQAAVPLEPLLRLAHGRGLGDPRHDQPGHHHLAALPRRPVQHRPPALRPLALGLRVLGGRVAAREGRLQPGRRDVLPARADGGDLGLLGHRGLFQAPAHRAGPAERHPQARTRRVARAAAGHRSRGRADRLRRCREPVRRHRVRARQDRGLHLQGLPRHGHLHRVRAVPVAVPGLEHRQAALAQVADHGPARSPVREGALHPG